MTPASWTIYQGGSLDLLFNVRDGSRRNVNKYDGTQTLTTTVWPGDDSAASFHPATAWVDVAPKDNTGTIAITGAQTAAVSPGTYTVVTRLDDAGTPVDVYTCQLIILPFAGDTP